MSRMHFITHPSRGSFIRLTGLIPFGHITEIFVAWWPLRKDHQKWNSKNKIYYCPMMRSHTLESVMCVRCGRNVLYAFPLSRSSFSNHRLNGSLQFLAHSVHIYWNNVCARFTQTHSSAINNSAHHVKPWGKITREWDEYTVGFSREFSTPAQKWMSVDFTL